MNNHFNNSSICEPSKFVEQLNSKICRRKAGIVLLSMVVSTDAFANGKYPSGRVEKLQHPLHIVELLAFLTRAILGKIQSSTTPGTDCPCQFYKNNFLSYIPWHIYTREECPLNHASMSLLSSISKNFCTFCLTILCLSQTKFICAFIA